MTDLGCACIGMSVTLSWYGFLGPVWYPVPVFLDHRDTSHSLYLGRNDPSMCLMRRAKFHSSAGFGRGIMPTCGQDDKSSNDAAVDWSGSMTMTYDSQSSHEASRKHEM
eukprot:1446949-Pleurochrysis_carterae.AAC.1